MGTIVRTSEKDAGQLCDHAPERSQGGFTEVLMRRTFAALVLVAFATCAGYGASGTQSTGSRASIVKNEILWDKYGVPHIFAADRESMFYAHGWAQMQNQANLLLHLYGESRGRAVINTTHQPATKR